LRSLPANVEAYNQSVPMEFTRALLAQAHNKDVDAILRAARFPFDPVTGDSQVVFVSREQYSRLCVELFRELGDESGGAMPGTRTPLGTTRLMALSMLSSSSLLVALRRAIEFNACCRVPWGADIHNEILIDPERKEVTLSYLSSEDSPDIQHSVLCSMAMWLRFCGWLIGQHIDITHATSAGARQKYMAGIRHFFPCPVTYNQPYSTVTFSARHLDARLIRDEAQLNEFLALAPYYMVIEPHESWVTTFNRNCPALRS